MQKAMILYP